MTSDKKESDKKDSNLKRLPDFLSGTSFTEETIGLLQDTIKFDTQNPPGDEMPLAQFMEKKILEEKCNFIRTKIIETVPNRGNLIIYVDGTDPKNHPTYGFSSHLDVVPVDEDRWNHPPFAAKRISEAHDDFIWGRGTFDMKQTGTAYMMALKKLIREGWRPKANIKFIYEADEERGGQEGMELLVKNHWEDVKVDFLLTEGGGYKIPIGHDFILQRGEKGKCQTCIKVKGVSGHGSSPDPYEKLAIYKLMRILNKIKKRKRELEMQDAYHETVNALSLPGIVKFLLKRKSIIVPLVKLAKKILGLDFDKVIIPLIEDTMAPTIINAGFKENVISPTAEATLDIRILPGRTKEMIWNKLKKLMGKKLAEETSFEIVNQYVPATVSPLDTPYYSLVKETLKDMYPKANLVPLVGVGATDMRHFRPKGVVCYGFTLILKDEDLSYDDLLALSHSPNERVSVRNLMLGTEYAYRFLKKL